MRGEDQQSGYEWSKLSLASTGKLVVRTGIKEVAGQTCALLDYGENRSRVILETVRHCTVLTEGHIPDLIAEQKAT